MKITKQIDVRLQKEYITPRIDCVQFDQGLELVLNFKDFEIPSGSSANFYVEKPSGKFVYQNCKVSSTKKITIVVENQALAEYGTVYGQVRITNSGTVSTFDIVLNVKKSRADAQAVESKNMVSAFDEKAAELLANLGIDTTLTKSGLAADSKAVGDEIGDLKQDLIKHYDSVTQMKTSKKNVIGDIVKTRGYYAPGDGGSATYIISENLDGKTYLDDSGFEKYTESFKFTLLHDGKVNFLQLGAVKYDGGGHIRHNKWLKEYIDFVNPHNQETGRRNRITLIIPTGIWFFEPITFSASNIDIEGVYGWDTLISSGTIIAPYANGQQYVWRLGSYDESDPRTYMNQNVKNLTFTSVNFTSPYYDTSVGNLSDMYYCGRVLQIGKSFGCKFENLNFVSIRGGALEIKSSYEMWFNGILNFRTVYNLGSNIMNFGTAIEKNISAVHFDSVMFESVIGKLINFQKDCKCINTDFGTINFEDGALVKNDSTYVYYKLSDSSYPYDDGKAIHDGIFTIEKEAICDISVNTIMLNNVAFRYIVTSGGQIIIHDTIVDFSDAITSYFGINIGKISHTGIGKNCRLLLYKQKGFGALYKFNVGEISVTGSTSYHYYCDTDGFSFINMPKQINVQRVMKFNNFADYYTQHGTKTIKRTVDGVEEIGSYCGVIYDENAFAANKLCFKCFLAYIYGVTDMSNTAYIRIPIVGPRMRFRAKTGNATGATSTLSLRIVDLETGETLYDGINPPVPEGNNQIFAWCDLDLSEYYNANSGIEFRARSLQTRADNILDVFYFCS